MLWFFAGIDGDGNIDYTKIIADGTGDRKWQISETGNYAVDINLLDGSIAITKKPADGVGDIIDDKIIDSRLLQSPGHP